MGFGPDRRLSSDKVLPRLFECAAATPAAQREELLERFRRRAASGHFLPGLVDPHATANAFQKRCPDGAAATIAAAERALSPGHVEVCGRRLSIGARPDWTVDPVSGRRAPRIHWSRIQFLDPDVAGDCKFTWELNRQQYLVTLGRAYLLTGDDRYVSLIREHVSSWIDHNPPAIGINWTSSLELAFRSVSWIWTLYLVRQSPVIDAPFFVELLKSLYLHARHIEQQLSTYFSPNTHITGEALGLLYIGAAFPEFRRASHWRSLGARILAEQLDRQLLADGVYFEHSTYYHRYTTDFCLHALLLARSTESWLAGVIRPTLDRPLDYLLHITRPDGTSPLIGDDDGGRLVVLAERAPNDFRDTLAIGAALLSRADCASVAGDHVDELAWLLGPSGIGAYDDLAPAQPACVSRAFPESGYFAMRESWDQRADWALVRCGPPAPAVGAHSHADALALELTVAGQPVLIDPGTYVYTASRAERELFRATAAHNTVTVDERASAEAGPSVFKWQSSPRCRASAWITRDLFDFFEGEHDGYRRLEVPAVHSRAVFFVRGEYWVIRDRIRSEGHHDVAAHFHWAPDVMLRANGPTSIMALLPGERASSVQAAIFARCGVLSSTMAWMSPGYGIRTPAATSVFRFDTEGCDEIVAVFARSTTRLRLHESSWRPGSRDESGVLTLVSESWSDTILTGPTAGSGPNEVASDAAWTWLRRPPSPSASSDRDVTAFALIHGRSLTIAGDRVFDDEARVECAIGRVGDDGWEIDLQAPDRSSVVPPRSTTSWIDRPCVASAE